MNPVALLLELFNILDFFSILYLEGNLLDIFADRNSFLSLLYSYSELISFIKRELITFKSTFLYDIDIESI